MEKEKISMNDTVIWYRFFENKGEHYLYFCENGKICKIDDEPETYDLKQNRLPKKLTPINCKDRTFEDICQNFKYAEIMRAMPERYRYHQNDGIKVSLLLVQKCNLQCTYCYADHGQYYDTGVMKETTAIHVIRQLVEQGKYKKIIVCFFGGEPLLNFPLIEAVVSYCEKLHRDSDISFRFEMTTNGTLLNRNLEKFIIEHEIHLQISIDGDKKGNDLCRTDRVGNGSYDLVLEKTAALRAKGNLRARATLTPGNMNFKEIYDHLYQLNFKKIGLTPAINMFSPDEYELLTEKHLDWLSLLEEHIHKKNYDYVLNSANLMGDFYKLDHAMVRKASCGAAGKLIAADIHGRLYPCHRFVDYKEFGRENIIEAQMENNKLWQNVIGERARTCQDCWALNFCAVGCIFNNYAVGGTLTSIREYCCRYFKAVAEKEIRMYIALSDVERKLLCGRSSHRRK